MKLRLDYETTSNERYWNDRTDLVIYKDGKEWIRGGYGGEPEDNSHFRDYSWVREAMAELAKELGAEVEKTSTELKE